MLKLDPNMIALGGEAFERESGHEGEAHTNPISALTRGAPESFLTPPARRAHSEKML